MGELNIPTWVVKLSSCKRANNLPRWVHRFRRKRRRESARFQWVARDRWWGRDRTLYLVPLHPWGWLCNRNGHPLTSPSCSLCIIIIERQNTWKRSRARFSLFLHSRIIYTRNYCIINEMRSLYLPSMMLYASRRWRVWRIGSTASAGEGAFLPLCISNDRLFIVA